MNRSPVVSICIPTYERPDILKETLYSIVNQNIDINLFEICISDDSRTNSTKNMIETCFGTYSNIQYVKEDPMDGYLNLLNALKMGKGSFLKLHNDYSVFNEGSLRTLISLVETENSESVIFFGLHNMRLPTGMTVCKTFDIFLNIITIWSTWSTSFGIWQKDFNKIMDSNFLPEKMFPHTSLLFSLNGKGKYIIDNSDYIKNIELNKKGGYNIPETFGIHYLNMIRELRYNKQITTKTYLKIKREILVFIGEWYFNVNYFKDKYTFSYDNWNEIIKKIWGVKGIVFIKTRYVVLFLKIKVKKIINSVNKI